MRLLLALVLFAWPAAATEWVWRPIRIGAGGWVTGLDISADGATKVVRTDTHGGYVWVTDHWNQLVTKTSMPAEDVHDEFGGAMLEVRVAPNDATRLYMIYKSFVYRSEDTGTTWTKTSLPKDTSLILGASFEKTYGGRISVDPANRNVVYLGGSLTSPLRVTYDGGDNWTSVTAVPAGTVVPSITGIVFDPSSGTTDGNTNTIYALRTGSGYYKSTDAGATWALTSGGPTKARNAVVASDGVLFVAPDTTGGHIWRYNYLGGGWEDLPTPGESSWIHSIAVDPTNPARILTANDGGTVHQSVDRGTTWASSPNYPTTRSSPEIPWLAWTTEAYMSNGNMMLDPADPTKLWFAEGISVWTTTVVWPSIGSTLTWTSKSVGIENLVANHIIVPPGGKPLVASWDRPVFRVDNPEVYPSVHGISPPGGTAIMHGWGMDYAKTDPNFIVAVVNKASNMGDSIPGAGSPLSAEGEKTGYSTDGGVTWTQFYPSIPAWPINSFPFGGSVAVSTPQNFIWAPANGDVAYYTLDGAATWNIVNLPGVTEDDSNTTGWGQFHFAYYVKRFVVAAHDSIPGKFYLYLFDAVAPMPGLFVTTDGGVTWTLRRAGEICPFDGVNAKLRVAPGHPGHLFFTAGHASGQGPANNALMRRSIDDGVTWTAVTGIGVLKEIWDFGFGAPAPGGSYPTIFISGWVDPAGQATTNGVFGIWRSIDNAATWEKIGDWTYGTLQHPFVIAGSPDNPNIVYVGLTGGGGFAYGTIDTDLDSVIDTIDNCTNVANLSQLDSEADGCGNACDGDFDENGVSNAVDLLYFQTHFLTGPSSPNWDPEVDMDGNSVVNAADLDMFRQEYLTTVGPGQPSCP